MFPHMTKKKNHLAKGGFDDEIILISPAPIYNDSSTNCS